MEYTLNAREQNLFGIIVRDYVESAAPVGSEYLRKKYHLSMSPATIRKSMMALEGAGFLEQPHTSSGRVPTEKGYRYYIEYCSSPKKADSAIREFAPLFQDWADEAPEMKQSARELAECLKEGVFLGIGRHETYYTGLSHLLSQPEFASHDILTQIGKMLDALDDVVARLNHGVLTGVTVLIGRENPFDESCATVVAPRTTPSGERFIIGVIGPMRMDYDIIIPLMENFTKNLP